MDIDALERQCLRVSRWALYLGVVSRAQGDLDNGGHGGLTFPSGASGDCRPTAPSQRDSPLDATTLPTVPLAHRSRCRGPRQSPTLLPARRLSQTEQTVGRLRATSDGHFPWPYKWEGDIRRVYVNMRTQENTRPSILTGSVCLHPARPGLGEDPALDSTSLHLYRIPAR
ncbi:hypothetical protein VTK73DRAFT_2689 [Phialemonium thermophilum]|uniref:Uncharacterized protein n=1 Tax=Phialemonium thermophilum TaxID=223376 RepID=A0ABR3VPV7_9PEZI